MTVVGQRIPEETIQDVLHRADMVDVIGDYVLLQQRGANAKGLCPFHQEKTPSFTVNPAKGLFYCFGCQASGNVIRFLMQHDNLTFPEAVRLLAERYGVRLPESGSSPPQAALHELYSLHQAATAFFQHCLQRHPAAQAVRTYCRQRQLSPEVVTRFGLGYAPQAWEALWREMQRQGFAQELLLRSGLVVARDHRPGVYDRFRHRLIFPIHDRQGRPIAFGGRDLEGAEASHTPKYLNSPETPIFQKNRTLYGFHVAKSAIREQRRAILVEGYTDVIACHRQGVTHVLGTLGTALTETHVGMLRGLTKEVILVFDADAAGGAATERAIGLLLDAGVRVRIVELPDGEDPDSFLQQHSGDSFLRRVDEAGTFLEYLLGRARRFHDFRTPVGQADCVARLLPLLGKIDNPIERWGYVTLLAEKLGLPPHVLEHEMQSPPGQQPRPRREPARRLVPQRLTTPGPREEYILVHMLYHDLSLFKNVQKKVTAQAFQDANLGALFAVLERLAPHDQGTVSRRILEEVEDPVQEQILTKMAMEPLDANTDCTKAVDDCLDKMQKRSIKAQRRRKIEQIRAAPDEAESERLLREHQRMKGRDGGGLTHTIGAC